MNWLTVAIIAQTILGSSIIFDKLFFRRKIFDPLTYAFWLGVLGLVTVILVPFGFSFLPAKIMILASVAGAVFVLGMLTIFYAIEYGEVSSAMPSIGGFSPVFVFVLSWLVLESGLTIGQGIGFFALTIAAMIFFFMEEKESTLRFFFYIIAGSFLLALSTVLSKIVFEAGSFISGFITMRVGGAIFSLLFLLFENNRKIIFKTGKQTRAKYRIAYFINRAYASVGSVLISFAVSMSHPALVDVTQGFKYVVIFFLAWIFLKERFSGKVLFWKSLATFVVVVGIVWLSFINYAHSIKFDANRDIVWGFTFSPRFSTELGLDAKENFEAVLRELKPQVARLPVYWDKAEREEGLFDFSETDSYLKIAEKYGTQVILTFGVKVPRWPECYIPDWAKKEDGLVKSDKLLDYIEEIVFYYKDNPIVSVWQVENEPFLSYGANCPKVTSDLVDKEIEKVRSIDTTRKILITDSGELGRWYKAFVRGDIFGTTMYRKIFPQSIGEYTGVVEYPLSPRFFVLKDKLIRFLTGDYSRKIIVAELQAEPWGKAPIPYISYEEQISAFSPEYFAETIQYAKDTGFSEFYLWGAEWWYYLKEKRGDDRYWNYVKDVFENVN